MGASFKADRDSLAESIVNVVIDAEHGGLTGAAELRRIGDALHRLADAITPMDAYVRDSKARHPDNIDDVGLAVIAKSLYWLRRRRGELLPAELFAEPAWDLLLDLFVSTVRGERITTKMLCAAADVPASTALRWIGILEGCGLIRRWVPPDDQRLTTIQMTSSGYERMRALLCDWLMVDRNENKLRSSIL